MLFSQPFDENQNCPQCGDRLKRYFKYSKLIKCQSCGSSIFLEDETTKYIGERSILSSEPSLIKLYQTFTYQNKSYLPIGKIRYSYGRGFWEEWFLKDEKNQEFWLSIDEGDFVLEKRMKLSLPFSNKKFRLGQNYGKYLVTEVGEGNVVGFEGELPNSIHMGEEHHYVHLSEGEGKLITLEFSETQTETFKGEWIDPLDIKVDKR